jgi:[acyl-carrier-protein] S-malonyltransferase
MISKAKEILGYDIWDVCLNGPEARLNSTLVSQPAIYLVSLAALEKVKLEDGVREKNTVVTCGLSLGEYTALAYAGVVTFEEGLRLVKGD